MRRPVDFDVALQEEIRREQASSLAKAAEKLTTALTALEDFNRDNGTNSALDGQREQLIDDAAERAWYLILQREAMGISNSKSALDFYRVPGFVRARIGATRSPQKSRK